MMASSDDQKNDSYQTLIPSTSRIQCQTIHVQDFDERTSSSFNNPAANQTTQFNSALPTYGGIIVTNNGGVESSTKNKSLINRILIILVVAVVGLATVFIHLSNTPTRPLPVSNSPFTTKDRPNDPIIRMRSPAPGTPCIPGTFHDPSTQLPPTHLWQVPGTNIRVPMYANHNLNEPAHWRVKYALIVQHGNNRNANDYYCAAVNSLIETGWSDAKMRSVLIIAPYFPIIGDLCWDHNNASVPAHNISDPVLTNCGYQVWSNEGWKDGHQSLGPTPNMFSYDVFNSLINYVGDGANFPQLKNITLFGFSAGAQTILRFAALTNYNILNKNITRPRFVVSDPSTYLYFTPERPYRRHVNNTSTTESANNTIAGGDIMDSENKAEITFQVPNDTWITNWRTRADGTEWIKGWSTECRTNGSKQPCCDEYNDWRYGFNNMNGYYRYQFNLDINAASNLIANFQNLDITYLVGTDDNVNCDLSNPVGCNDNDLATYCPAMLQGDNRLDRALNWQAYLLHVYKRPVHRLFNALGVAHDPVQMLRSTSSRCAIFNVCDVDNADTDTGNGAGNDPNDLDPPCGGGGACGDTPYPDPTPAPTLTPTWEPTQYPTTNWKGRSDKSYFIFVFMGAGWIGMMLCLVCVQKYGCCEWYSSSSD